MQRRRCASDYRGDQHERQKGDEETQNDKDDIGATHATIMRDGRKCLEVVSPRTNFQPLLNLFAQLDAQLAAGDCFGFAEAAGSLSAASRAASCTCTAERAANE